MSIDQAQQSSVENDIKTLEAKRYAAMEGADVEALDSLLADGCSYTHSDASTDNKADYLARVGDGTFDYGPIDFTVERIVVLDGVALAFGQISTDAKVHGTVKQIRNIGLSVWVAEQDRWRLKAYQPTAIPQR